ncbi:MAG: DedA family protein [Deltaproteobacteria bacterium]
MAEAIFQTLTVFFARYGLWVIFFGVMLENAGLPVPGETILLFAGFLAYRGEVHLWHAMMIGIAAATLGDTVGYVLGRNAGTFFVEKYVRRFRLLNRQFIRAEAQIRKHGHWAVFVSRFITGLRVFAGPLAGIFRMPFLRFLFFDFTGALIWGVTVVSVGFLLGGSWENLTRFIDKFHRITFVAGVAVLLVVIGVYYFRRRKNADPPRES